MDAIEKQNELTDEEIKNIILSAKKTGLRDTIDLYLLDYIKHCFLEEGQLSSSIEKLQTALPHIADERIKSGVQDVLDSLNCVQNEYNEYLEDMRVFPHTGHPHKPKGRLFDNCE